MMSVMSFPTLTERKAAKVAAMAAAVEQLGAELAAYGREHGGRFVLFGSAARGELRDDSDVDILADFPGEAGQPAWDYAEERGYALGLKPDVHLKAWVGRSLRDRIATEGRVLE